MKFLKKNLMFLLSAGLIISSVSTSFAMKRSADVAGLPSDVNPRAAQVQKAEQEAHEAIRLRMEEVDQYRNRFIEAIKKNDQEALVFFDKSVELELSGETTNVALKNILFSDLLLMLLKYSNPEVQTSFWKRLIDFVRSFVSRGNSDPDSDSLDSLDPSVLISILENPFKIIFKQPGQIDNEADCIINYLGINIKFIFKYISALLESGNYNFNIEDIEKFLRNNREHIDVDKVSPQINFMIKAIDSVVEDGIDYSTIYEKLKDSIKKQDDRLYLIHLHINNEILAGLLNSHDSALQDG